MDIKSAQIEERRWGRSAIDLKQKTLPSLKAQRVLEAIKGLPQNARILDYGCGEGKLLATIKLHRPDLIFFGIDIQRPLDTNPFFKFSLIQDDECVAFHEKFDSILCLDVLEHVPDLEITLKRISDMLNAHGKFVIFVPAEGENFSPFRIYRKIFGNDIYVKTKSHIQAYKKKDLLNLFRKYFEIENISYSYHVFGTILDATFFALTSFKGLGRWFWKENSVYHSENKGKGFLNRLMEWANTICFAESTFLKSTSIFATGLHVVALKK